MSFRFLKLVVFVISSQLFHAQAIENTRALKIDSTKSTIKTRFQPPKNYQYIDQQDNSFGGYLLNFPLYPQNFPIRDYRDMPIAKQYNHVAVLKIDVGAKDLQQCADAWIRLYAEYLYAKKDFDEINFQFTSGQNMSWLDFKNGMRTIEIKERVKFIKNAKPEDSYENFRKYLDLVFNYAGTISLHNESEIIKKNEDIQVGDFLIKPGSPGHSVIIVGIAKNNLGKRVYLLAESFMPAQDIHIIINPLNSKLSPWYELDVNSAKTITAKYIFEPTAIKRFHQLME